jgi:hypothetical protein
MTKHCDTCTCDQPPPRCPGCTRWTLYLGSYDTDGHTWRCHGCLRIPARCTCT